MVTLKPSLENSIYLCVQFFSHFRKQILVRFLPFCYFKQDQRTFLNLFPLFNVDMDLIEHGLWEACSGQIEEVLSSEIFSDWNLIYTIQYRITESTSKLQALSENCISSLPLFLACSKENSEFHRNMYWYWNWGCHRCWLAIVSLLLSFCLGNTVVFIWESTNSSLCSK